MTHQLILAPSLLASDHGHLAGALAEIESSRAELAPHRHHGRPFRAQPDLRPPGCGRFENERSDVFFDTHLMLENPVPLLEPFAEAGSSLISIHVEPDFDQRAALAEIRALGCQNGIVLNPDTPIDDVRPYLHQVDLVLLMTVQPGFGGQSFREDVLPKIEQLTSHGGRKRDWISGSKSMVGLTRAPRPSAWRREPTPSWPAPRSSSRPTMSAFSPPFWRRMRLNLGPASLPGLKCDRSAPIMRIMAEWIPSRRPAPYYWSSVLILIRLGSIRTESGEHARTLNS